MVLVKLLSRTSDNKSVKPGVADLAAGTDAHLIEAAVQLEPPATDSAQLSPDLRKSVSVYSSETRPDAVAPEPSPIASSEQPLDVTAIASSTSEELKPPVSRQRRFSWRGISLFNGSAQDDRKRVLTHEEEQRKKAQVAEDRMKRAVKVSSADRKARESAVIVRSLIVGQSTISLANTKGKPVVKALKPKISKVKAELMQPKKANRVIAQLRALPPSGDTLPPALKVETAHTHHHPSSHPIHAVCLPLTDVEADAQHFSKLTSMDVSSEPQTRERSVNLNVGNALSTIASVYNTSVSQLTIVLEEMHVVSLLQNDLGLGRSADEPGLLAGAMPTAKAVIQGVEQMTPEIMSLGYATGKVLLPDHSGIYPPTDRMSVLTYWWGFEVVLPPPSIEYLSKVPSIAHSVINVLTALSVLDGGAREILPFVRYISTFIDTEFNMIKKEDHGKGVVCAATWLVPVALVPRAWDFPDPPSVKIQPAPMEQEESPAEPASPAVPHHDIPGSYADEPLTDAPTPHTPASPASPTSPAPSLPPLPASPTLLPPLPSFDSDDAPKKVPEDERDFLEIAGDTEAGANKTAKGEGQDLPVVAVVPPTPPVSNTLDGAPGELVVVSTAEFVPVAA